jgi:hypothetical protein
MMQIVGVDCDLGRNPSDVRMAMQLLSDNEPDYQINSRKRTSIQGAKISRVLPAGAFSSYGSFQSKNSTAPVSRLYIAPVILIPPFAWSSASTGLSFRISATVISTFFRATASTKA